MKSQILPSILISLFSATALLNAQESTPEFDPLGEHNNLPKLIRVQVEFIEMPHTALTKLMKTPRTSANDTDLREACDKLIEKKGATVLETASVTALPGQNATSESISEFIYATEYEPSEIVESVKTIELKEGQTYPSQMTPPTPTAFDTKNLGTTLEVEAMLDANSKFIELRVSPTLTYFTGFETWSKWDIPESQGEMKMPTFYVVKVKAASTLISGQPQMISALSPKDEDGNTDPTRKIMVFVRADILTVGK